MGKSLGKGMLRFFMAVSLPASCMTACDERIVLPDVSTVELSGRVVHMLRMAANPDDPSQFVIEGATVALEHDATVNCVTDEGGFWSLTVPNDGSDPFLKITKREEDVGPGEEVLADSYFQIPVGTTGISQMDVTVVDQASYYLLYIAAHSDPVQAAYEIFLQETMGVELKACLVMGPTAGFTDVNWPQKYDLIQGMKLQVVPEDPPLWEAGTANADIKLQYWSMQDLLEVPWPDPSLDETSNVAFWSVFIPDASKIDKIGVYVVEERIEWDVTIANPDPRETLKWIDGWLHAHEQVTRPGGFITSGTMNYLYESSCVPDDPCLDIDNTDEDGVCYGVGTDGDYGCECLDGYVWDQVTHQCLP